MSNDRLVLLACTPHQSLLRAVAGGQPQDIVHGPYGHRRETPGLPGSGFNGQWREPETGWYLLGNGYRAYNPVLMRFNSPDSWSPFGYGGLNAYVYCLGDPVNRVDPNGHSPFAGMLSSLTKLFTRISRRVGGQITRRRGWQPLKSSSTLPDYWTSKHGEDVLKSAVTRMEPDDLAKMRRVSSAVRDRVDQLSITNFNAYSAKNQLKDLPDRDSAVRQIIQAGSGQVPGVSPSHAAKLRTIGQAREQFAQYEDKGVKLKAMVGTRKRPVEFVGQRSTNTHVLVRRK